MKTLLIILVTPFIVWSLLRALIIPALSAKSAAGGLAESQLTVCRRDSNCVTSAPGDANAIPHLAFPEAGEADWQQLIDSVTSLPGYKLIKREGDYVHFESRTPLMNYRDDLELLWQRDEQTVAIRSASRLGIKDLGANAARVSMVRKLVELQQR